MATTSPVSLSLSYRAENKRFSTLKRTKTGGIQPKLNVAYFVQSCFAVADFVVFSNYCLIGTRRTVCYFCCLTVASGERNDMAYKFKYNERPRSYSEEKHGDEDIPSAKAVRDTAVEERDDKIIKSRRQHVCGREYIVFAEFSFGGTQSTVDLMKQVIDLEQDAKNISA